MADKQRIDVFISSTSLDLPQHRAKIIEVLNRFHFQPIAMEHWPASGISPLELCRSRIYGADIFIGIYAYRYGWCPGGYNGMSITELEYDWAGEVMKDGKHMPRLCFIMSEKHPITIDMVECEKKEQLETFKERVQLQHVDFFESADDLRAKVTEALIPYLPKLEYQPETDTVLELDYAPKPYPNRSFEPWLDNSERWIMIYFQRSNDGEKDRRRLRRLHSVITKYPGNDRFSIILEDKNHSFKMEFPNDTTGYCNDLVMDILTIVGDMNNIEVFDKPS